MRRSSGGRSLQRAAAARRPGRRQMGGAAGEALGERVERNLRYRHKFSDAAKARAAWRCTTPHGASAWRRCRRREVWSSRCSTARRSGMRFGSWALGRVELGAQRPNSVDGWQCLDRHRGPPAQRRQHRAQVPHAAGPAGRVGVRQQLRPRRELVRQPDVAAPRRLGQWSRSVSRGLLCSKAVDDLVTLLGFEGKNKCVFGAQASRGVEELCGAQRRRGRHTHPAAPLSPARPHSHDQPSVVGRGGATPHRDSLTRNTELSREAPAHFERDETLSWLAPRVRDAALPDMWTVVSSKLGASQNFIGPRQVHEKMGVTSGDQERARRPGKRLAHCGPEHFLALVARRDPGRARGRRGV